MTDYNKIITTVNSITPDYQFIPDLNNTIVIDTSENRIGINTITPDENIHVSGGTIKTQDLIVLGDFSVNNVSSNILPRNDLSYNIGSITHRWKDLFIGSGSMYMDKTRIFRMADYTRHNGVPGHDISALVIDNSGKHLDISDIRHVNIQGDVSLNKNLDLSDHLLVHGDVSFMSKFYVKHDASFNNRLDIKEQLTVLSDVSFMSKFVVIDDSSFNAALDVSGVLHIKKSLTPDGLITTGTKIYTTYEKNSEGNVTTRLIIDPSGDGIIGDPARQGEVVIYGNLDVKGTSTFIKSTNVEISDNIIRMNAGHSSVTDGGIAVINSSGVDKLFTYNNPGDYWTTNDTDINLGPNGGVVSCGFMNIDNVNIDGNSISTDTGDLNISSVGGDIYTQNTNLDLGTGVLTVNSVANAHVPTGSIILWYGTSSNVPTGWAICNGSNGTPNLQGRFVVCSGTAEHTYVEGQSGGTDDYTLSTSQIPSHNHGASSQNTDVQHNHGASSQNTDVQHNHVASSQNTDVQHNHVATSSSENTDVQHNHPSAATTEDKAIDHRHDLNPTSGSNIGNASVDHTHEVKGVTANATCNKHTINQRQHSHNIHHRHTPDTHTHAFSAPQHTHTTQAHTHANNAHSHTITSNAAYDSSSSEGGDGVVSIMTDDQTQKYFSGGNGPLSISSQCASSTVQMQGTTVNVNQTAVAGTTDADAGAGIPGDFQKQSSIDGTRAELEHTVTVSVNQSTTGNQSTTHKHTLAGYTANYNPKHAHDITVSTEQVTIDHNHVIETATEQTTIDHNHEIQTQQTSINHNHEIQTQQTSINHNHVIQTQNTGGGQTFDNRPKWYSLWYIMKL